MVTAPMTNILFPMPEQRKRIIAAATTLAASGGAAAAKVITIGNEYPEIDRSIPNPILAILVSQNAATQAANSNHIFTIAGTMAAVVPDQTPNFFITGARTISVWQLLNNTCDALVIYVAKGSGANT